MARSASKRMSPLVDCILQYAKALDVMSNANPLPVSLIWGSMRIVLQLARSFEKYFEKLLLMFERIGDIMPRFDLYSRLFPDRLELMNAMTKLYGDVIEFCLQAGHIFKIELSRQKRRFHIGTSAKVAWKNCWKDFELQFGDLLELFREHKNHVEAEAKAAAMEDSQARLKQLELQGQDQIAAIQEVRATQGASEKQEQSVEFRSMMLWLGGGIEYEAFYHKHVASRYAGTGDWFLEHPTISSWIDTASSPGPEASVLWCYGPAGIGKTSLCSYLIQHLIKVNKERHLMTLYHFCDFRNHASTRSTNILGCLLRQALEKKGFLKGEHKELLQARQYRGEELLGDDFAENLEFMLENSVWAGHFVIDALDECVDPDRILQSLLRIARSRRIKLLVVSRDSAEIRSVLAQFSKLLLSSDLLEKDVREFIVREVERLVDGRIFKTRNKGLPSSIAAELSKRANGMFLWAKPQLESISRKHTGRTIHRAVEELPHGLVTSYQRILAALSTLAEDEQQLMKELFRWIIFSVRPMTVGELSICLLAVNTESGALEDDDIVTDVAEVALLARGLLVVEPAPDEPQSTVVVSHRSVQDFLVSVDAGSFMVDRASTHAHAALVALKYLLLPSFRTICESGEELSDRFVRYAFLDYSARSWPTHVAALSVAGPDLLDAMVGLFTGSHFLPWLQVYKSDRNIPNHQTFHWAAKPLYWAARLGLKDLVTALLSLGADINETGGFFGTPLMMAAYNSDTSMVKLLLANGADVNCTAGQYHTALQAAAFTGNLTIIDALIAAGADIHTRGGMFSTALVAAEKAGHDTIISRLLELGAARPQACEPADKAEFLGTAILRKDAKAVKQIIQSGIDINARLPGFSDWEKEKGASHYPLILAISVGDIEVLKCIINSGADLDVSDGYHGTALAYAAYRGKKDVVLALLEGGANPLAKRGTYSGSTMPAIIRELDAETKAKMNKGKGLRAWAENITNIDKKRFPEEGDILDQLR